MPPTRGHDLKLLLFRMFAGEELQDAPHTGARLETSDIEVANGYHVMPPTRGHDLKHVSICAQLL